MITVGLILNNLRLILIIALVGAVIWFWKDYNYQKIENIRQSKNNRYLRMQDSLKYFEQTLNNKEFTDELKYNNQALIQKLDNANIKMRRIESIITQELSYKDTLRNEIKIDGIIKAIKENHHLEVPVIDSTACLVIRGSVIYDNNEIFLNIKDRKFTNVTDVVAYWERKKGFLGIRWGKKQATVKVFNSCGETITKIIDKK